MCRFCNTKSKAKLTAYPRAAHGCLVLADMLNGQPSPPSKRLTDAMEALQDLWQFINFEILDNKGGITMGKIRHEVLKMLNIYLGKTGRNGFGTTAELQPTAQELVDMVQTCQEACENRTALDPHQAKEFAKRFTVLGELIGKLHD